MTLRTVEIIGGGLAGLALGLALRARGVPVRLHEAGRYPRHRVCGEFLTGLDADTIAALGLGDILAPALTSHHVSWHEAGRRTLRHRLPEPALSLSRHCLDLAMARQFTAAGGELSTGQRAAAERGPGRIFACGRRPQSASQWIGLKQHFHGLALDGDLELHLGTHAYVGLTRVEADVVNVCGLFPRPACREGATLTTRLRGVGLGALAQRLESAAPVEGSSCAVAGLDYSRRGVADDSIGDHAGLIPPFTGHGMTIALQSAAWAAPHPEAWSRGRRGWKEATQAMRRTLDRRFARRLAWGRIMHPWLLRPRRRAMIHAMHRLRLLPFGLLYRLCH